MCNACAHEYGPLADPETTFTDHGTEESDSEPDPEESPSSQRPHDYGTEPNCNTSHYRPDHEEQDSDALSESVHDNGEDGSPRRDVCHDGRDGRYEDEPRQSSSRRNCHDVGDGRYEDRSRRNSSRRHHYDDSDGQY
ncbi:hypothetical protein AAVH_39265 [Aphelenchoides avenae]|nr:hypothetical protein AAVH_39265 [Aphelenchus avenae]